MKYKKGLLVTAFILCALAAGGALHFFIFAFAFHGSSLQWLIVLLRIAFSFGFGFLCRRYVAASLAVLLLVYSTLECGPIFMMFWALFNYSETGKIGFNLAFWILPAVVDLIAIIFGSRIGSSLKQQRAG
jgi:hypothetical protein